jgi:uncharacterized protein (TIGR03084 family)
MDTLASLLADLTAEHAALDARVAGLDESGWRTLTPADGWTVADSVSHLWFFDGTAALAASDPAAFAASTQALLAEFGGGGDPSIAGGRAITGAELLQRWRDGRAALVAALEPLPPDTRVPWYGPAMSAASFTTARLMETWAHGQDVADALGLPPVVSDRLRHICHIGVRARPYAYMVNGLDRPTAPVAVELVAPDGSTWGWDVGTAQRITGTALDFALVVTQRRHPADTALATEGDDAAQWLGIAQAFAGPAGAGRPAGMFSRPA